MGSLQGMLTTLVNFLMVVVGFSSVIFLHELGHFLAARWAKIRVLAFAIGFGPALVSYRPGLGWRRGSSDAEYRALWGRPWAPANLSHTEYRLNVLPLGGYVRMLGQEDGDPTAVSAEPDSFQMVLPWKRLIVISAGVVMNLITAAVLFIIVFKTGLPVTPAAVGGLEPGGAASRAIATNAKDLGLSDEDAHLKPGDRIVEVAGEKPNSFSDVMLAASMAARGRPVEFLVDRPGLPRTLRFSVVPETHRITGLLDLGLDPPSSGELPQAASPADAKAFAARLAELGLPGVTDGMRLTEVNGRRAQPGQALSGADYEEAFRTSAGRPVPLVFEGPNGRAEVTAAPRPKFQVDLIPGRENKPFQIEHLLGLTPVMTVAKVPEGGSKDLREGDLFARIGAVEFPSPAQGQTEIQSHANRTIPIAVLRKEGDRLVRVDFEARVDGKGHVGFYPSSTMDDSAQVSRAPEGFVGPTDPRLGPPPAAARLDLRPGTRILAVDGTVVRNFADLRSALLQATRSAAETGAAATIKLTIEPPSPGDSPRDVSWVLRAEEIRDLHALGWQPPVSLAMFKGEEVILRASSPSDAVRLGLRETRRVMLQTYMTFARLFDGTVKVEHLQGPVGIAHVGTVVASRGIIWLLFFFALISVNLAVVNFLPLPIVDGGQFLMILYEQLRGRPLPIRVQEIVTVAGIVLIGAMFLMVTFNDVKKLIGF